MKALFTFALCACVLGIQASALPKDTVDSYVIDNVAIAKFDGTQLVGKTIDKYTIAYKGNGKSVEKCHVITTRKSDKVIDIKGKVINIKGMSECKDVNKALILLNGKEVTFSETTSLKPEDISNVTILKAGSKAAKAILKQRGRTGNGEVMIITSKVNEEAPEQVIYINGKKSNVSEMKKLQKDGILSMTIKQNNGTPEVYIVTK